MQWPRADQRVHSVRKIQFRLYLAEAQRKQGKLDKAEQNVRAALEHTARNSNSAGYVQCLDALAEVFHDGGNYPAMEQVLKEALRIESTVPQSDPLRSARRVHRLGIASHKSGRSEDAIPSLEKAVTLHEQLYGVEDVETADLLSDLGVIYRAQGNHTEAQRCLRRALRIHEKVKGVDAPETVSDLHNLAGSLEEAGDTPGAAAQYERALMLKERVVGRDLDEMAESFEFSLAGMHIDWNNYGRARELLAEALGVFKRNQDQRLAVTHETLAYIEECSGRYQEAVKELALAAKVWQACGAERQAELVQNLLHRAELLDQLRKKSEAAWLRETVEALTSRVEQLT